MNAVAMAEIGHNSASYMQMIEADPAIVYRDDDALPGLAAEIEALIAAASGDVGTKKGREAIASLAHSIARRKTPILDAGKRLTEDWRKKTAEVNGRKSQVERDLDALRDKVRAPLDAWEAAEKARIAKIDAAMSRFRYLMKPPIGHTTAEFDVDIASVEAVEITDDFGDQRDAAEDLNVEALTALRAGRAAFIKAEAERAELETLRKAALEADAAKQMLDYIKQVRMGMIGGQTYPFPILLRELEEKISAADYSERFRAEIEAARIEAHEHLTAAFKEHMERGQREAAAQAVAAAEARVKAEQEAAAAQARAEQEAALAAERRRAQEAQDALAAEQRRQAAEKAERERAAAAQAAADAERAADHAHRGKIMGEAKTALMTLDLDEAKAKQIVLAICAGTIPHTRISF